MHLQNLFVQLLFSHLGTNKYLSLGNLHTFFYQEE